MIPAFRLVIALAAAGLADWLLGRVLPKKPRRRHLIAVGIAIVILILLQLVPIPASGATPFEYSVTVRSASTGNAVENAKIILEAPSAAPLVEYTDTNGFARFSLEAPFAGANGRLTVEVQGFARHTQAIDVTPGNLPGLLQLEPVTQSLELSQPGTNPASSLLADTPPDTESIPQSEASPRPSSICTPPADPTFLEPFDDNSRSWSVGDNIDYPYTDETRSIQAGAYKMSTYFQEDALTQSRLPRTSAKDFFLQSDFRLTNVTPDNPVRALLAFRGTDSGYFVARFGSDGKYSLYLRLDDYMNPIIDWKDSPAVQLSPDRTSTFAVVADGWQLTLCADGSPIDSITLPAQFTDGWLAVGVSSLKGTTSVTSIDNVLLDAPD